MKSRAISRSFVSGSCLWSSFSEEEVVREHLHRAEWFRWSGVISLWNNIAESFSHSKISEQRAFRPFHELFRISNCTRSRIIIKLFTIIIELNVPLDLFACDDTWHASHLSNCCAVWSGHLWWPVELPWRCGFENRQFMGERHNEKMLINRLVFHWASAVFRSASGENMPKSIKSSREESKTRSF